MENACRKLASSYPKLVHFEICVLANLAPGDAEEAKLMIPSIVVCLTLAAEDVSMVAVLLLLHRARCLKMTWPRLSRKSQHTDDLCQSILQSSHMPPSTYKQMNPQLMTQLVTAKALLQSFLS